MTQTVLRTALAALGTALAAGALTAALLLAVSTAGAAAAQTSPGVETTAGFTVLITPAET